MKNIIFLVAALIAACAAQGCSPDVTSTIRPGSWDLNGGKGVIYDINVTNTGNCPLIDIGINPGTPLGSETISYWNLVPQSRFWLLSNYGGAIQPGQTATAGLILYVNTTDEVSIPSLVITVYGTNCDAECVASFPTEAPASSEEPSTSSEQPSTSSEEPATSSEEPSTSSEEPATSSDASSSDSEVPEPTNTPSEAPVECNIVATVSKTGEWEQDGVPTATYSLSIYNAGSTSLKDYVTGFGYYPGTIIQTWNLEPSRGGYKVINFGDVLLPGQTFSGAGFIIANATEVLVQPYGSNCL